MFRALVPVALLVGLLGSATPATATAATPATATASPASVTQDLRTRLHAAISRSGATSCRQIASHSSSS